MFKYDPILVDFVFVQTITQRINDGAVNFGDEVQSDLAVDAGERNNDTSELDSGLRIIDGNI